MGSARNETPDFCLRGLFPSCNKKHFNAVGTSYLRYFPRKISPAIFVIEIAHAKLGALLIHSFLEPLPLRLLLFFVHRRYCFVHWFILSAFIPTISVITIVRIAFSISLGCCITALACCSITAIVFTLLQR